MSKALIIAEKPSVAADLAKALGRFDKKDNFFENDQYVISSAVGHLVELIPPSEMEKTRGKWSFANLPILPEEFGTRPIEKNEARFKLLKRLLKRPDVTEVINACDAGREGELIFRLVLKHAGVTNKPIRRLWLQSMTADSIRDAFAHLRSDSEMQPLANAAYSRSESDWLVGINATRAMTAFNSKLGGFQLTPVGRVQTPTLTILCEREDKIRAFKPRPYFEVYGDFGVKAGDYRGRWFDPGFKKGADEDGRAERLWDRAKAEGIAQKCDGKIGSVSEEKKPASQVAPMLYDLTTLQREANSRFGFSAKRTLQIAQALYEKHKVLTYPRTDSRHLPEDYLATVKATMSKIHDPGLAVHARKALESGWVKPSRRIFDNAKVSDHFAIIPTGTEAKHLDEVHQKLFDFVVKRFIAAFYPSAQFEVTTRITKVEGEQFRTDGRIIVDPGWMAVYGREAEGDDSDRALVVVAAGEDAQTKAIEVKAVETKPPARYTEATLLSAMEGAGKLVDDEELRAAMSEKGLGTPATRAAIIEGLIAQDYMARNGRELVATAKGLALIALLRGIGIQALTSPELTGEWEAKLKQIEAGKLKREDFMKEIRDMTREIVEKTKNFEGDTVEGDFGELDVRCPKCGARPLKGDYRTWRCGSCDYVFWKTIAGRVMSPEEATQLIKDGRIGPLEGFRSKMGRAFAATLKLNAEGKAEFDFGDNGTNGKDENGVAIEFDFSKLTPITDCKVCNTGRIFSLPMQYVCENAVSSKPTCKFKMGRTILQREIPPEQVVKLMQTGKTDLLPRFISKKGRPFSAFLKLEPGGKVSFEFAPRAAKPKKVAAKPTKSAEPV
jgi:DNA topoisomerase III